MKQNQKKNNKKNKNKTKVDRINRITSEFGKVIALRLGAVAAANEDDVLQIALVDRADHGACSAEQRVFAVANRQRTMRFIFRKAAFGLREQTRLQ